MDVNRKAAARFESDREIVALLFHEHLKDTAHTKKVVKERPAQKFVLPYHPVIFADIRAADGYIDYRDWQ